VARVIGRGLFDVPLRTVEVELHDPSL
jgi:hypothetical protein